MAGKISLENLSKDLYKQFSSYLYVDKSNLLDTNGDLKTTINFSSLKNINEEVPTIEQISSVGTVYILENDIIVGLIHIKTIDETNSELEVTHANIGNGTNADGGSSTGGLTETEVNDLIDAKIPQNVSAFNNDKGYVISENVYLKDEIDEKFEDFNASVDLSFVKYDSLWSGSLSVNGSGAISDSLDDYKSIMLEISTPKSYTMLIPETLMSNTGSGYTIESTDGSVDNNSSEYKAFDKWSSSAFVNKTANTVARNLSVKFTSTQKLYGIEVYSDTTTWTDWSIWCYTGTTWFEVAPSLISAQASNSYNGRYIEFFGTSYSFKEIYLGWNTCYNSGGSLTHQYVNDFKLFGSSPINGYEYVIAPAKTGTFYDEEKGLSVTINADLSFKVNKLDGTALDKFTGIYGIKELTQ